MLSLIWRFSRPHTLIGSSISITAILFLLIFCTPGLPVKGIEILTQSLISHNLTARVVGFIPVANAAITGFVSILLPTLSVCLACNIFITGLNQIVDVELDKINKPHLPLASGELSLHQGKTIVIVSGLMAIFGSWMIQPFLGILITVIAGIGAMYSLPPIQFKRHHVWAASAIALVRGPLINVGISIHFATLLFDWPVVALPWLLPLTVFITAFSLGIAWFKDIPDTQGDQIHGFKTLALVWSRQKALSAGKWLVGLSYLILSLFWFLIDVHIAAALVHLILLILFWGRSSRVDLQSTDSIKRFYLFYWGLFFLEYLILPLLLA
ncbi:MAG: homogentisate phytyltransferase [Bacteroidetes bacterium]|nr:homogentisate phytyltransferase [Bacteroidota bacterium]